MRLTHRAPFSARVTGQRRARCPLSPCSASSPLHLRSVTVAPAPKGASHSAARQAQLRTVAATPASSPSPSTQPIVVELPASQQEAVEVAVQCLLPALQPLLVSIKPAKTAKGFSNRSKAGSGANRFGVEIPGADPSPQAVLDLAALLLSTTAARLKQRPNGASVAAAAGPSNWTIVHAREDALQLASRGGRSGSGGQVMGLRQACQQPQLAGLLLLVEPQVEDVALVEQLLDEVWVGPAAVVLNPQWGQQGQGGAVPEQFGPLVESINVAYSFLPCAIQGLLGPKEGAVLRTSDPAAAKAPWRILLKEKEEFIQVGAMSRRPTPEDLEIAFLNASAAASPLTKTAKFLRGLIPGGKK